MHKEKFVDSVPQHQSGIFDACKIQQDFPILQQQIHGQQLCYLDNAATTQKPQIVIDAVSNYYQKHNANIHRGVHQLSMLATDAYEKSRQKVADFIRAQNATEIVFVRGATEAINLIAQSYARQFLKSGDEIILSEMEHHANIVPWQMLAQQTGIVLRYIPINEQGELIFSTFEDYLNNKTKLVSIGHISNALGTINPIATIIEKAHAIGAKVVIDGAQAVAHMPIDVQQLDCDFYVFSGHKLFAPTGIGVLYGKQSILEAMPPYQGGGDMIKTVSLETTTYNDVPYKFEAGTPNIAGSIGLGAAIDYLTSLDFDAILHHEEKLLEYAQKKLSMIEGIRLIGTAAEKSAIVSFVLAQVHPHDIGTILDNHGVAIRTGHHCAMPVMEHFAVPATARASFTFYNTTHDIDRLVDGIDMARMMFT